MRKVSLMGVTLRGADDMAFQHDSEVERIEGTPRRRVSLMGVDDMAFQHDKDDKERIEGTPRRRVSLMGVTLRGVDDMAFQHDSEGQNTSEKESEMKERYENTKERTMEVPQHSDVAKKSWLSMYTSVLSSPPMLLLLLSHFLTRLGISSFLSLSTDRVIQFGGVSKAQSSLLLSIIGVSNCLGSVVFGQLLDRWKQHL